MRFREESKSKPGAAADLSGSHPAPFRCVTLCERSIAMRSKMPLPTQKYERVLGSMELVRFKRPQAEKWPRSVQLSAGTSYCQKVPVLDSISKTAPVAGSYAVRGILPFWAGLGCRAGLVLDQLLEPGSQIQTKLAKLPQGDRPAPQTK